MGNTSQSSVGRYYPADAVQQVEDPYAVLLFLEGFDKNRRHTDVGSLDRLVGGHAPGQQNNTRELGEYFQQ
jgi:hypothetical protein